MHLGNHAEALRAAAESRRLAPAYWQTHVCVAQAALAAGQPAIAATAAAEARRLAPNEPDVHFLSGKVALARGDLDGARGHQERALALDPAHSGAMNELGRIRLRRHDTVGAIRHFISAARTTPGEHIYSRNIDVVIVRSVSRMIYIFVLIAMILLWIPAVTHTGRAAARRRVRRARPGHPGVLRGHGDPAAARGPAAGPPDGAQPPGDRRPGGRLRRRGDRVRRRRVRPVRTSCRRRCRSRSSSRSWPGSSPPPGSAPPSARTRQATAPAPLSPSPPPAAASRRPADRASALLAHGRPAHRRHCAPVACGPGMAAWSAPAMARRRDVTGSGPARAVRLAVLLSRRCGLLQAESCSHRTACDHGHRTTGCLSGGIQPADSLRLSMEWRGAMASGERCARRAVGLRCRRRAASAAAARARAAARSEGGGEPPREGARREPRRARGAASRWHAGGRC